MIDLSPDIPAAPDVAGATREAIETEFELLGPRLKKELEFRPQFAQADINTLLQFAPQFADIQQDLATRERALQEKLFPEEVRVERAAGEEIFRGIGEGIPEDIERDITERFRAEEAAFGRFGSPVGSLNVARSLGITGEQIRQARLGQALSFAGKVPFVSGTGTPVPRPVAQPTLTGGLTGAQLGLTGSIFGTQTGAALGQGQQRAGIFGDILGAGATLGSAFI